MTVKDYFSQGYRLENRIRLVQEEIRELRDMAVGISSPGFEEHYNASRNTAAPFEKTLLKISELEERRVAMLERLITFKDELIRAIDTVQNMDERLVLHYRYICNWTWVQIGEELGWDERTIRRLHNKALSHVTMPESFTTLE